MYLLDWPSSCGSKVRHLSSRVDSGVCASRADHVYLFLQKLLQGVFKLTLHTSPLGLDLPSDKSGPIVFDQEFDVPR
jgi:hypothetical protein